MSAFRTVELSDPSISAEGLEFVTVKSDALGRRADVTLWVSPEGREAMDLPMVVLLHGAYGSHWAWALKGAAHLTAARLIAEGALPPVALVMPSDGLWGDGSGFVAHEGADYECWIIDEAPALAVEVIPGCTARSPLLVAGLSMGGFGALTLAGKHPDRVTAAAGHSSITAVEQLEPLLEESTDGWSKVEADRSVLAALKQAGGRLPPIRFDCGVEDFLIEPNRQLHADLTAAGIAHDYVERPGGHDWDYWSREVEETLRFFGRVLQDSRSRKVS